MLTSGKRILMAAIAATILAALAHLATQSWNNTIRMFGFAFLVIWIILMLMPRWDMGDFLGIVVALIFLGVGLLLIYVMAVLAFPQYTLVAFGIGALALILIMYIFEQGGDY